MINGIGSFHSSFLTRHHILSDESIKELKQYDAVGDFALQFLSKDGNAINTELTKNLIKADVFKIADHARCVIAIAEGLEKLKSYTLYYLVILLLHFLQIKKQLYLFYKKPVK